MTAALRFCVDGAPRTKKNHGKVVQRGKRRFHVPSDAYTAWCERAVPQMRVARRGAPPIDRPVNVRAVFFRDAERGDAVGYYQALADALQAAGVVADDKWIESWDGSRLAKDAARPRIEIEISVDQEWRRRHREREAAPLAEGKAPPSPQSSPDEG